MDAQYDMLKTNHSCRSMLTMETYDTTNNTSMSSGASLDVDVHGLTQTKHVRPYHRNRDSDDFHSRSYSGDSCNSFGESFMMEESFAFGESFTCYENGCSSNMPDRYRSDESLPARLPVDISSILIIEEDCEDANFREREHEQEFGVDNHKENTLPIVPVIAVLPLNIQI
jgi:hypothetical protein